MLVVFADIANAAVIIQGSVQIQEAADSLSAESNTNPPNEDDTSVALAYAFQTFSYADSISQTISLNLNLQVEVIDHPSATLSSYLRGDVYVIGSSRLKVVDNSDPDNFQTCYNAGSVSVVYSTVTFVERIFHPVVYRCLSVIL